ncbi:hypothetical protein OPIT5_06635 [Opitutaceae bacterium TAV5]|nr:hypothetical protein OPIT5_06635 [Opitutaceae bacterium TAV5]
MNADTPLPADSLPADPSPDVAAAPAVAAALPSEPPLAPLEARALGCLIEKELTTPDVYPLTLNSLVNACNQRNNRAPVLTVSASEVEAALEGLRQKRLAALFAGADARVPKFRQTLDLVYPLETAARAVLAELLLRGPQTTAELRTRAARMHPPLSGADEVESLLADMAARPAGPLVRRLPRQPGQKEARWAQLLTGEPAGVGTDFSGSDADVAGMPAARITLSPGAAAASPAALPPETEQRLAALEAEVTRLRTELAALREALGGG